MIQKKKEKPFLVLSILFVLLLTLLIYTNSLRETVKHKSLALDSTHQELATLTQLFNAQTLEKEALRNDLSTLESTKKELEIATKQKINELKDILVGHRELLIEKDSIIDALEAMSEELFVANTQLKQEKNTLYDSIKVIKKEKTALKEKLLHLAQCKAENIRVSAITKMGTEKKTIKANQLAKIKVAFEIAANEWAAAGQRNIRLYIIDPWGDEIFNVLEGSGSFVYKGREKFYAAQQEINYDNTCHRISFVYDLAGQNEKGVYTITIYEDSELMGSATFIVE
ncbi:MAG: hypothetical protein MI674_02590 [Cytophagales bacterium]|nr:hypothetical protein [Cytophagales bacterium]